MRGMSKRQRKTVSAEPSWLKERIENTLTTTIEDSGVRGFLYLFGKDIKVRFATENFFDGISYTYPLPGLYGINTIGDLTFCGMVSGGDWEHPVFFIVYWDGKKLRAYIPSEGNPYNQKTMQAIGNGDHDQGDNPENYDFEEDLIRKDIIERFGLQEAK
jgi:hypothetical protein